MNSKDKNSIAWQVYKSGGKIWIISAGNIVEADCIAQIYKPYEHRAELIVSAVHNRLALLSALKLAVHALNQKPNFGVNCSDQHITTSYQIAAICDKAIISAEGVES